MAQYVFPAVLTLERSNLYSVWFPDLESCYTCGDDLQDALRMAKDVLTFTLYDYENENRPIPKPSGTEEIQAGANEFVRWIACDTMEYRNKREP